MAPFVVRPPEVRAGAPPAECRGAGRPRRPDGLTIDRSTDRPTDRRPRRGPAHDPQRRIEVPGDPLGLPLADVSGEAVDLLRVGLPMFSQPLTSQKGAFPPPWRAQAHYSLGHTLW